MQPSGHMRKTLRRIKVDKIRRYDVILAPFSHLGSSNQPMCSWLDFHMYRIRKVHTKMTLICFLFSVSNPGRHDRSPASSVFG